MGVYVDKGIQGLSVKSSEAGRKSAFSPIKLKMVVKTINATFRNVSTTRSASKGGCCQNLRRCDYPAGVRNSIDYMNPGVRAASDDEWQSRYGKVMRFRRLKEHMIDRANDPQNVFDDKGKENKSQPKILCFHRLYQQR